MEIQTLNLARYSFNHIALCGFSRSGTTLLHQMLLTSVANAWVAPDERSLNKVSRLWPRTIITKRPLDIFDVNDYSGFRRLCVLIIIRDPRDIITSRHAAVDDDYFIGADYVYHIGKNNQKFKVSKGSMLSTFSQIKNLANMKNTSLLKYEELVERPENVKTWFERVWGLKFKRPLESFHLSKELSLLSPLNGVRSPETTRIGKWKRDPDDRQRVIQQFQEFPEMHQILFQFGYEINKDWLQRLSSSNDR